MKSGLLGSSMEQVPVVESSLPHCFTYVSSDFLAEYKLLENRSTSFGLLCPSQCLAQGRAHLTPSE